MSFGNKRKQSSSDENEMKGQEKKSKTKTDCINEQPVSAQAEQSTRKFVFM